MTTIIQLRNRPAQKTARRTHGSLTYALWIVIVTVGLALTQFSGTTGQPLLSLPKIGGTAATDGGVTRYFAICGGLRHDACVIDGDTFRYRGEGIRIADIDAPETHPARCASEARLGAEATQRLQELLSAGPFSLRRSESRDEDRYGRKLRTVMRDGRSLGAVLVSEGLARRWTGRRLPWCA